MNEELELNNEINIQRHIYNDNTVCITDDIGYKNPGNKSDTQLVLDVSDGFIPLWDKDVTLNWRFSNDIDNLFKYPIEAKEKIEHLLATAILKWDKAVPIKFKKVDSNWDFEVNVNKYDECSNDGCVLASAFFPDSGRHQLILYPKLFEQSEHEQIETLIHELGHIFGLRHFFANISEKEWESINYGNQNEFTIMNYGEKSTLTEQDIDDLYNLYQNVWLNTLIEINGTKIVKVRPYHEG